MAKKRYTPAPDVPPEVMQRLAVLVEVLAGMKSVSEGARALNLSRNHFQTLLHRGLAGMLQEVTPHAAGRPAKPEALANLEAELQKLRRENDKLQARVGSTERLLTVASELLKGRIQTTGRRRRSPKENPDDEGGDNDPEPTRLLAGVDEMRRLGLTAMLAASIAGVHEATVRRWRVGAPCRQRRPARCVAPETVIAARQVVRDLHGLVGAESLRHSVGGLSRRAAARIKALTLTEMERERQAALTRVTVTAPGIVRGMDAMHLRCAEGPMYALIAADGAVPYRTSVTSGRRYDTDLVTQILVADIEQHGAPLVYRLDRATAHDAPEPRAVLEAHGVMVLHGPPHCPRYYGQLERQNREHRAWLKKLPTLQQDEIEDCLAEMLKGVNEVWRRRTLGWRTAAEVWDTRPSLTIDRQALQEEVTERTARLAPAILNRGKPEDLAERLAIEQTLVHHGWLQLQHGGWC